MRSELEDMQPGEDFVGVGLDLTPSTLLTAYTCGLFPMGVGEHGAPPIGWWSPDPRGVLDVHSLRVTRSLRRSLRRFEVRIDSAFDEVVAACADPARDGRWITPTMAGAYGELHRLGLAHSVECWQDGALVGGLYGVGLGGLFAGESMFHRVRDASKVALVALTRVLNDGAARLIDVQWCTDHLASLGVVDVPREVYLRISARVLASPEPDWFWPGWDG